MDLPIVLKGDSTFVTGVLELKQDLYLLLKEPIRTWYQSARTGSYIPLHSADVVELRNAVKDTLAQLKGVEIKSVEVVETNVILRINYNGRELEELFELNN
jgi:hypothetical protein